jgi:GR25 family glycosyltransferase involved in LPS biosynthesis
MKIFVIHYKALVDRKIHIIEQFEKHNITDYEFVEIDRDELYNQDISMFQENYSNSQIAISLSHFYAYQQIKEKYDQALIFEDDVLLCNHFTEILNYFLTQLPNDYDMLFIGDGCNFHIEDNNLIPNQHIYRKDVYPTHWGGDGCTRCTDSYIVSKKCAIQLCNYITNLTYKIDLPIDWWLNVVGRENNLNVYWAEPTIVTQGTQNGLFQTSH